MKSLLVFTCVLCAVSFAKAGSDSEEVREMMKQMIYDCAEGAGVSKDELTKYKDNKDDEVMRKKISCVVRCMFTKMEIMTNDGDIDKDKMYEIVEELEIPDDKKNEMKTKINECTDKVSSIDDICERALVLQECGMDE